MYNLEQIKKVIKEKGVMQLYAYSRKSRDLDGEGLQKHHDVINDFAKKIGLPIKFYEEVGSSETLKRPMMNQLRQDIEHKQVECLIVYRLDRLSRKVTDTERLLKEFSFNDIILIEAHREKIVDYKESLGIKLEAMMSDLYQEQAKMVLYAGRQKAVQMYGNHLGQAPLGYSYNKETKKLEPNEMAWAVKKAFELFLDGDCTYTIATKLNEIGVRSTRGGSMIASTVHRMLKNEKYKGVQIYGKKEWYTDVDGKVRTKKRPKEEWMVYENAHEPIIPSELFDEVQKLMVKRQKKPHASRRRKFSLTQVVKCSKCGRKMSFIRAGTGSYKTDTIRTCFHVDWETGERCGNKGMPARIMEDFIKKQIWEEVRPLILKTQKELAKDSSALNTLNVGSIEIEDLKQRRSDLEKQINNAIELQIELGKDERLLTKIKQLKAQVEMVTDDIEKLEQQHPSDSLAWVERFLEQNTELINFPINYKGMSESDKNKFIQRYVEWVEVEDREIIGIKYTEDVRRLKDLINF